MCCGSSRPARWTCSRSTPRSRATGTSSAVSRRAPCCSARSRARSTPWSAGRLQGLRAAPDRAARAVPARVRSRAAWTDTGGRQHGRGTAVDPAQQYVRRRTGPGAHTPLEHAFALGIGRSLGVLFEAPLDGDATAPVRRRPWTDDDDPVDAGRRRAACSTAPRTARRPPRELLVDAGDVAAAWSTSSTGCCPRWTAGSSSLERAHEDRTAAGIKAGEAVRAQADQALLASIGSARATGASGTSTGHRRRHVRRLPAGRARPPGSRSPSRPKSGSASSDRIEPGRADRAQLARSVPARSGSTGRWWRDEHRPPGGPPGRVRGAGRAAVAARPVRGGGLRRPGCETRSTRTSAEEFEPRAVMFYRPLPEAAHDRLAAAALQPARHRAWTCAIWLLGGLVTVGARRAGADRDRHRCSACTCRTPRRASSSRSHWPS